MDHLSPERWKQIDALFAAALERPPEERGAFLARECAGDPELRREVEALLQSDQAAAAALGESVTEFAGSLLAGLGTDPGDDAPLHPGSRVGPYRILEEIGRGGMGAVYKAERADHEFEKLVAIKVVKRGMDTDEVLQRFRAERQILASLEHPNIARLLDGGVTGDGRPYLVMEHVNGMPIDVYCDERRLDLRQRLKLFATVCPTVHDAHRRLVVHRDLKPSNILITAEGEVKLLDFGIAKLLDKDRGTTPRTRNGVRLLTPDHAAPEQLRGEPVTTAADIYGLGTVLYQLLVGRRPFRLTGVPLAQAERILAETTPVRPSVAACHADPDGPCSEDLARARGTTVAGLSRALRGDLDTITLKALARDPGRRYDSSLQLAEDIQRHLDGQPVLARPDGRLYRMAKFIGRHRTGVAAATVIVLSLISGLATTLWQAERAERERRAALEVTAFLENLFRASDPFTRGPERLDTLRVRDLVRRGTERVRRDLSSPPEIRARLLGVLGRVHANLGLYAPADSLLSEAVALATRLYGPKDVRVAAAQHHLATVYRDRGDLAAADSLYRIALATRRQRLGPADPATGETVAGLGETLRRLGRYAEADTLLRSAVATLRARGAPARPALFSALNSLANVLQSRGEYANAERVRRESVALARRLYGERHPRTALALANLAATLVELERVQQAEPVLRQALAIYREALGDDHPSTLGALNTLALLLNDKGDYQAAEAIARAALAARRRVFGDNTPAVFTGLNTLAVILYNRGDYDAAEPVYREQLALSRRIHPDGHVQTAIVLNNLATLLRNTGRIGEAEPLQREALDLARRFLGDTHPAVGLLANNLGELLQAAGRHAAAAAQFREAVTITRDALPSGHPRRVRFQTRLAESLRALHRFAQAESVLLATLHDLDRADAPPPESLHRVLRGLATLYDAWGRPERAATVRTRLAQRPPQPDD